MKQIPILAGILIGNLLLASAVAGQDTAYINRLNNSAFNLRVSNPDSADQLAREALQLSETPAYWHGIGSACQVLGLIATAPDSAAVFFQRALLARRNNGDSVRVATILQSWAAVQYDAGDYKAALANCFTALKIMEDPAAPTFGPMSAEDRMLRLGYLYIQMSKIYAAQADSGDALRSARKAWAYCRNAGKPAAEWNGEFNLAQQYFEFGDSLNHYEDSAAYHYRQLLAAKAPPGVERFDIANAQHNLALVLIHQADPAFKNEALALLDTCRKNYAGIEDTTGLYYVDIQRAHWVLSFTGDTRKAISILENVMSGFDWLDPEKQLEVRLLLADLYFRTGQFQQSARLYDEAFIQNDTLRNQSLINQMRRYEEQRHELQLARRDALLQQEKIKNRNLTIGAILALLLLLAAFWLHRRNTRKKRVALFEKIQTTSQKYLEEVRREERFQLGTELHGEIATPLASLAWVTETLLSKTPGESPDHGMIEMLHRFLKEKAAFARDKSQSLRAGIVENVTEQMNLDFKQHITDLCSLISGNINTAYNIDTENPPAAIKFHLGHVIQELITNTLKYAKASQLSLKITQIGQELHLEYSDNGVGIETGKKGAGVGMEDIARRVAELEGRIEQMGNRAEGGFFIHIVVPVAPHKTNQ
ncbi:MAG TPA: hypothetical protein PKL15_07770 [Saprospiraceae bacterium]|nr:hypothetical protein [Saprospiraceae bacterium]